MRCQIPRILPDAPDKGRAAHRQPWQAKEIDPLLGCHTAVMNRLAIVIEHIGFQPVESLAVPGGPDDVGDSRLGKIEMTLQGVVAALGFVANANERAAKSKSLGAP